MKKFFICLLSMFLMISLAACGSGETESVSTAGELTRKLKSNSDKVIEVSEDIVLTKAIEIVGNKEIVGSGSITVSVADMEEGYIISLSDGASLTIGGSVKLDLSSLAGGIHVKEGTELVLQDEAVVTGASVKSSNVLVEGTFTMNGGSLKHAKGHNLINKGKTTIAGGELKGSGKKYAIVYNEGTLVQNDGTIVGGYHNVVGASGSSFEWNKGEITTALLDAIVIDEGASIHITSANAKLTGVYAKGLVVNGEGVIDGATMKDSMDSMVAVGVNGKLTLNDGKITEAGVHGIDNAGNLLMTNGVVFDNAHSGICNTGTLNVTGGDIMNNGSKGVLNKAGVATITSEDVMITGNDEGVSNEIGAYFELSAAEIIQNTDSNVYAYGGEMYIHDIALSSSKAASISVISGDVILENVDVQGTTGGSGAHGVYMTGGSVVAKKVNFNAINGSGLRIAGEAAVFEGKDVTFDNIQRNVFYVTAGKVDVDGFTTKDVQNYNVYATGGELNLSNATFCKTKENNVRTKNDTVLNLTNVEILGNTKEVAGTVYGLIIDDGTVTAKNLIIRDTYAAAIRLKGGTLTANKVTITNAGKHGINAAGGVGKITNLTTSNVTGCNVYMTSAANLTLTDAELGKCTDNSIKEYGNENAVLNLTNVTVLGHTKDALESVYGLIVDNGTVTAKNLKIQDVVAAGIRVRGGSLTADDVNISDTGEHGINVKSGTTTITNLKTTNVNGCNIYMTGDAKLTVANAELGKCTDNSIKEYGNEKAVLDLTDVTVLGHTEDALASVHGLIIDDGTVTAKNLKIQDVVSAGLRVRGGNFTAEDVVVSNSGLNGMYMNGGTADITGLKILTAPSNGVYMTGGIASITDLKTSDVSKCNINMKEAANLTVTDAELGKCADQSIYIPKGATEDLVLNLNDVTVLGHTEEVDGTYINGLTMYAGSVTAKDLEIRDVFSAGVRIVGGNFKAEVLKVSDTGTHGVHVSDTGVADITNLTTSDISKSNIYMTGDANLTVTGEEDSAELGICGDHCIRNEGNAELNLTNVTVRGITDEVSGAKYAIFVAGGSVNAKDLVISDEGNVTYGVCVTGGEFDAEIVTVSAAKTHGVCVTTAGTAKITGLTVLSAQDSGVCVKNGILTLNGADITDTKNGVYVTGGTLKAEDVTISDADKYGIYASGGTAVITTLTTGNVTTNNTTLTADNVATNNIFVEGSADLTVTDAKLGKCAGHSIQQSSSGTLKLTDVTVLGHTDDASSVHGLYVSKGTVIANTLKIYDVKSAGLRVNGGSVEAEDVTISGADGNGVAVKGGNTTITTLETSEVVGINIYAAGDGANLTVNGAELGKCKNNSIQWGYNGTLNLTGVTVYGHEENTAADKHGLKVTKGTVNANNLVIHGATANGVDVTGGTVTLNGANVTGTTYDIYNTTSTLRLAGVIKADVVNNAAVAINAGSLAGSDMTIDWIEVEEDGNVTGRAVAEGFVGIQFDNENAMTATSTSVVEGAADGGEPVYSVRLGANVRLNVNDEDGNPIVPVANYYNSQMVLVDPNNMLYTVDCYDSDTETNGTYGLKQALADIDEKGYSRATIKIAGNIIIPEQVTIVKGKDITLVDDGTGTVRNIVRGTSFDTSKAGLLFAVEAGASLTFDSTGTDTTPLLIVDGSKDSYGDIGNKVNWTMVQSSGTLNVNKGVKFTNNATGGNGGAISVTAGTLTVNGGTFGDENKALSGNYGGAINIQPSDDGTVTATIENATFEKNTSANNGGVINIAANTDVTINGCKFKDNSGSNGGAIFIANGSRVTIEECTFSSNTATEYGGAIVNKNKAQDKVTIKNCTFTSNTAKYGGAISLENKSYTVLKDCTFTSNEASEHGKDIRLASDVATQVHISGQIVAEIVNEGKNVLYVDGALEDGSDVKVEWKDSIPDDSVGIVFAADDDANMTSEDVMNASKPYIRLGDKVFLENSLAYVNATNATNATGKLVVPIEVSDEASWKDAWTKIESEKIGVIRLKTNIDVSSTITIPENSNVTIEDDGSETPRTLKRTTTNFNMIVLENGSTLTLRSTGTLDDCKLILDGAELKSTKAATMIYLGSSVNTVGLNIYKGVKLQNNASGKGGSAIAIESQTSTVNVIGAYFNKLTATNGGAIYVNTNAICNIKDTMFDSCEANNGGAIYVNTNATCNIKDTMFVSCEASNMGGAIFSKGILSLDGTSEDKAVIKNCSCKTSQSAVYIFAGTLTGSGYKFTSEAGSIIYVKNGSSEYLSGN